MAVCSGTHASRTINKLNLNAFGISIQLITNLIRLLSTGSRSHTTEIVSSFVLALHSKYHLSLARSL